MLPNDLENFIVIVISFMSNRQQATRLELSGRGFMPRIEMIHRKNIQSIAVREKRC